jgi:hypothetical protein
MPLPILTVSMITAIASSSLYALTDASSGRSKDRRMCCACDLGVVPVADYKFKILRLFTMTKSLVSESGDLIHHPLPS